MNLGAGVNLLPMLTVCFFLKLVPTSKTAVNIIYPPLPLNISSGCKSQAEHSLFPLPAGMRCLGQHAHIPGLQIGHFCRSPSPSKQVILRAIQYLTFFPNLVSLLDLPGKRIASPIPMQFPLPAFHNPVFSYRGKIRLFLLTGFCLQPRNKMQNWD